MKKYIKIICSSIVLFAAISGCEKDFLEKYPLDQVSSGDFFKTVNDMIVYIDPFYLSPGFEANWSDKKSGISELDSNSDTQTGGTSISDRLRGTRTVPASGGSWNNNYRWVRRINYFFDNYKKIEVEFAEYQQYVGEAHFFRALTYFQLLVEFGDVPWYNHVLGTDSEGLYDPRTPRNIVADNIIADLDSAALYLSEDRVEGGTRIDKWYALGFQSVVALYEGTWEKYHDGGPFGVSNADPDKYLNKAVEAAEAVMNSERFALYSTGNPEKDYYDFFIQQDYSSSNSVMFWHKYSRDLDIYNEYNSIHKFPNDRGLLTKGLADSYLCTDGDPISVSPLFAGYDTIIDEMKDRDPRFVQTFFHPDYPWLIEENDTTTWGDGIFNKIHTNRALNCATAYMFRKFYNSNTEFHGTEDEENPVIRFRYAHVLLNFAEARAELGVLNQGDLDRSINLLRDRVGMPYLDLANIATDPDWDFKDALVF